MFSFLAIACFPLSPDTVDDIQFLNNQNGSQVRVLLSRVLLNDSRRVPDANQTETFVTMNPTFRVVLSNLLMNDTFLQTTNDTPVFLNDTEVNHRYQIVRRMISVGLLNESRPFVQKKCVNGVLDVFSFRCICLINFAGDRCDQRVLNFEPMLKTEQNQTERTTDYSSSFIEHVIGNYWTQLDLHGLFMQKVNYQSVWNSTNVGFQIQQMKLFTQQVYKNFDGNFVQYRRVLKLLSNIFRSSSDPILRKSKKFAMTQSFQSLELALKKEVGVALNITDELFIDYVNLVHDESNSTEEQFLDYLTNIESSTLKYASMVNDYGYWFFLNELKSRAWSRYNKYFSLLRIFGYGGG
jgi:hypothetical protein